MKNFVVAAWNFIFDHESSPLRHIPDFGVRHMVFQLLGWMWAISFSIAVGSYTFLAISLIAELRRNAWNVPGQLSVMGFDGIALGTQMHPTLCSVVQPIALLASTVIDQLLAQIAGNAPISHCLPCHIRPGESTQPFEESLDARIQ